jgi:hypothetical protein
LASAQIIHTEMKSNQNRALFSRQVLDWFA